MLFNGNICVAGEGKSPAVPIEAESLKAVVLADNPNSAVEDKDDSIAVDQEKAFPEMAIGVEDFPSQDVARGALAILVAAVPIVVVRPIGQIIVAVIPAVLEVRHHLAVPKDGYQ